MDVPAICNNCSTIFRSGIFVENSTNITFAGNTAGPCPVCGGIGHVPDGVFNFVGNAIEILSAPQRTRDELRQLDKILREAQKENQSTDQIVQRINKEVPALTSLISFLPTTRSDLYAFLALIVAVITLITQNSGKEEKTTNITVNQTINQVFIETDKNVMSPNKNVPKKSATPKVGRNAPCTCGSGKIYKKCCGSAM